jgi:hypothetical protein
MRKALFHQGKSRDLNLYSLLREECRPLKEVLAREIQLPAPDKEKG